MRQRHRSWPTNGRCDAGPPPGGLSTGTGQKWPVNCSLSTVLHMFGGGRILYLQILPFLPLKPTKVNVGDISVGLLISAHADPAPSDYRHNTSGLSWSQAGVLVLRIKGFRPKYELLVKKATLESKRQDKIIKLVSHIGWHSGRHCFPKSVSRIQYLTGSQHRWDSFFEANIDEIAFKSCWYLGNIHWCYEDSFMLWRFHYEVLKIVNNRRRFYSILDNFQHTSQTFQ